jgi:arylsulfatase A-like enzyme/Tfp pilus assembly protein PilF
MGRHRGIVWGLGGALGLAAAAALLAACGVLRGGAPPAVVLISIDTCRADHLGCYGDTRSITPELDRFAQDALRCTRALASVPMTLPSHCTMFTGTSPLQHGVHDNLGYRLAAADRTVAEVLQEAGWRTAAVVGSFVLNSSFGLAQGFEHYDDDMGGGGARSNERPAAVVTRRAIEWLGAGPRQPFFLFVHYFDPHTPYAPPAPYAAQFPGDPYRGEIAYVDAEVGRLLARLREVGLYDRSLIIVAGDHGEALGEHGESGHGYFIYQSTLRVPLLIKPPGGTAARALDETVGLIDIAPTILGRFGLSAPAAMTGRDLLAGASTASDRDVYCESFTPTKYGCAPLLGLVRGTHKYVHTSRPELYDLAADPGEASDLVAARPERARELKGALDGLIAGATVAGAGGRDASVSEEVRERLQSLGYVAGRSVEEGFAADTERTDPKDRIALHERFDETLNLLQTGRLAEADARCREMLRDHGALPVVFILRGDIAHMQGRMEDAEASYRQFLEAAAGRLEGVGPAEARALRESPELARVHYDLALTLAARRRTDEALAHYRQALEADPRHLEARLNLASLLAQQGKNDEALAELLRAVEVLPGHAPTHLGLGELYTRTGDLRRARASYDEAVRLRPDLADAWTRLIRVTRQLGDEKEARRLTEAARRRFPGMAPPR